MEVPHGIVLCVRSAFKQLSEYQPKQDTINNAIRAGNQQGKETKNQPADNRASNSSNQNPNR
jgi:hypothetical protein